MYVMKRFVIIPVIIAMLMVGVASAQEGSLCPFGSTLQELAPGDYCSDLQFTSEVVGASTGGYVMSSTSSMYALNSNLVGATQSLSRDLMVSSGSVGFAQTLSANSNVYNPKIGTEYTVAFSDDGVGFVGHAIGKESTYVDFVTAGTEGEDTGTYSACDASLMGSSFNLVQGAVGSNSNMNIMLAEGGMPNAHEYTVLISGLPWIWV